MKNTLYILWYANRYLKEHRTVKKINPVALALDQSHSRSHTVSIELCLFEGISQSVKILFNLKILKKSLQCFEMQFGLI